MYDYSAQILCHLSTSFKDMWEKQSDPIKLKEDAAGCLVLSTVLDSLGLCGTGMVEADLEEPLPHPRLDQESKTVQSSEAWSTANNVAASRCRRFKLIRFDFVDLT